MLTSLPNQTQHPLIQWSVQNVCFRWPCLDHSHLTSVFVSFSFSLLPSLYFCSLISLYKTILQNCEYQHTLSWKAVLPPSWSHDLHPPPTFCLQPKKTLRGLLHWLLFHKLDRPDFKLSISLEPWTQYTICHDMQIDFKAVMVIKMNLCTTYVLYTWQQCPLAHFI